MPSTPQTPLSSKFEIFKAHESDQESSSPTHRQGAARVHRTRPGRPLTQLFATTRSGVVFVSAFPDRKTFSKFHAIAWETEVWIADAPDHMIHYNGQRFLGPYAS